MLFWRRPVVQFQHTKATAIKLVVDGISKPLPMRKNRHGVWKVKVRRPHDLAGKAYHFEAQINGSTVKIADPFAHRTARVNNELVSYFSDIRYRWRHGKFKTPPLRDTVIYETHLPALSRHSSAHVEHDWHRGTYLGAKSGFVLNHLKRLNVAVEFLPLHASDKLLGQDWGYFSISFHAIRECYAVNAQDANRELMSVIDAMHGQGVPVLLDVVFNHGGELWVKAWGKDVVYRKFANGDYCHGSGCGPTICTENPFIRESIIQALLHLVNKYRFDGFRFDLGALHDKQTMLEIDARLPPHVYLIAEPWALGGTCWGKGDLHGDFANTRWAVWNDDFRESGKTFIRGKGDHLNRDRLMCAIKGTHYRDGGWARRPQQCINYLSSHDGMTLADYVKGNKHRVYLGVMLVLTSQGVPMLSEGTELMFSKHGHDNSYANPELNQINWDNAREHQDLFTAVADLIALRKHLPHFTYTTQLRQRHQSKQWDIDWIYPTGHPHHDNVNAIGYILNPPPGTSIWRRYPIIVLLNGSKIGQNFQLPKGMWKVIADGRELKVNIRGIPGVPFAHSDYHTHAGTGVILAPA
jgi:pullulanase